jgi:hypothetical protein
MAVIHGATLNASVNPNGLDTQVKFLYGTDEALATPVELVIADVPAGRDAVLVSAPITDLTADTIYFFKVSATNSEGTSEGAVLSFTTPVDTGLPVVETLPATDLV